MKYYEVYHKLTGELIAKGTAAECREQLGCASMDSFYALANRSLRGINKSYDVVVINGGNTTYPVLGKDDPIHEYGPGIVEDFRREERKS